MLNEKNFIPINSVMRLVTIMVLGVILAFYLITGLFIYAITEKESDYLTDRINNAFNIEHKHNVDVVKEYSYWDETYRFLFLNKNEEWIIKNINNYIFNTYDYDWIGVESDGSLQLSAKRRTSNITQDDLEAIEIKSNKHLKTNGAQIYYKTENELYEITVVPFVNETTKETLKENLIFAIKIDELYLNRMVNKYELPSLYLSDKIKNKHFLSLKGSNNQYYGSIYWNYESPTRTVIPYMSLIGIILLGLFIIIVRKILFNELKESAKYEEKLYEAATKDYLTNISNRRFFLDQAEKELNLLNNENRDSSFLILDIDHFKNINDKYGHSVGDKALIHFSHICRQSLRKNDLIGRIGGEEFAIFLPDSDKDICLTVSERIHNTLLDSPLLYKDQNIHLTVSIGCCTNENNNLNIKELVHNSDIALYQAKNNGRNQTSIFNLENK